MIGALGRSWARSNQFALLQLLGAMSGCGHMEGSRVRNGFRTVLSAGGYKKTSSGMDGPVWVFLRRKLYCPQCPAGRIYSKGVVSCIVKGQCLTQVPALRWGHGPLWEPCFSTMAELRPELKGLRKSQLGKAALSSEVSQMTFPTGKTQASTPDKTRVETGDSLWPLA